LLVLFFNSISCLITGRQRLCLLRTDYEREARRVFRLCEQARKDAIFLRKETFELWARRSFAAAARFVFITSSPTGVQNSNWEKLSAD